MVNNLEGRYGFLKRHEAGYVSFQGYHEALREFRKVSFQQSSLNLARSLGLHPFEKFFQYRLVLVQERLVLSIESGF